ncbi:MAG: glutamate racemase [Alkaliphilus sp.]
MLTKVEKQKRTIDSPIGVFDSGIGGISVLAELVNQMSNENFVYYADSANAPYGKKTTEEVKQLALDAGSFLVDYGIKALVVACNTATSAAINELRNKWAMPIVGMEPALKPAIEANKGGKIVAMATSVTIKEEKFAKQISKFSDKAEIIKLPCPGLAWLIENNDSESEGFETKIEHYLEGVFRNIKFNDNDAIVLGCTHYVFIKDNIIKVIDKDVLLFDGNKGTVMQLGRMLGDMKLAKKNNEAKNKMTTIKMINSSTLREKNNLSNKILLRSLRGLAFKGRINFI